MSKEQNWAILDRTGLLIEYRTSARKPRVPCQPVPPDCDLVPRRYRWTGERFDPVPDDEAALGAEPTALHAIALDIARRHNGGETLHPVTLTWLRGYAKSVDNKMDEGRRVILTR